jgi:serine/threonine protein kinase
MILQNKYRLEEEIGRGEFGAIYRATNIRTGKEVAIKREPVTEYNLLQKETKVYQYLHGSIGFPEVHWYGIIDSHYYMAITLLGNSLRREREINGPFSLELVRIIRDQMLDRLHTLHSKGLIHRDIKPDNFLFPLHTSREMFQNESIIGSKKNVLYLIDFGFCKKTTEEIKNVERKSGTIVGTPNYVSIRVEEGWEPGIQDDIESVAYVLYYLWKEGDPNEINKKSKKERMREAPESIKSIIKSERV